MIVKDLIREAASKFAESDTATLDAQLLLGEVLGKDRSWIMTWDDSEVTHQQQSAFQTLVSRRVAGEPIAYILGRREFWGLELNCNSSTLIPRPETELLVELALKLDLPENANVLDLGTGTGTIALALASEKPSWNILAVDSSVAAIELARSNQNMLGFQNVEMLASDWFSALEGNQCFDLIVSNPPYIDPSSPYLDQGDVRYEPRSALVADEAGMKDIEQICAQASDFLKPNGWLMFEHGFDQQVPSEAVLKHQGYHSICCETDLSGLPRVSIARI